MATPLISTLEQLPLWDGKAESGDWLLGRVQAKAGVFQTSKANEVVLANGLVARRFRLSPNLATVELKNLQTGEALIRAVKPEAEVTIDGKVHEVGGLKGQPDLAYLSEAWIDSLTDEGSPFILEWFTMPPIEARMKWGQKRRSALSAWPPKGAALTFQLRGLPQGPSGLVVRVRYELYDGAPLFSKSISLENPTDKPIRVNAFKAEILALVEADSSVDANVPWHSGSLQAFTDYTFAGQTMGACSPTVQLLPDKTYTTQVNYNLLTPCLLEAAPPIGPDVEIPPKGKLDSFHVFELVHDSTDRERRGLAVRKLYRLMAPWTTESPLMLHQTSTDPKTVKTAIDQAAECGFEMVILSFGSGLNMEDASPANVAKFKELAEYAHAKGIEFGGYSLLASRRIDDANDVIDPKSGKPGQAVFGNSPCLGSEWGRRYFENLRKFMLGTGFDLLEHDGSYPGDVCASTSHPGHKGLEDSQWTQYQAIADFYRECRGRGVYLNVPDNYHLAGSNKTGMGYRETNWSLPRAQQHIHARQNLFDGTWEKPPTMGWMFTPLVEYHGGGPTATIEPLKEHLEDYRMHLVNNLAFGAQSCYRGPRLYDSPEVRDMVKGQVAWFKKYRDILESDVVHVRRANGRDLDCILHVNPSLPIKGLAVVWNPSDKPVEAELELPLYYSGLTETALIARRDGRPFGCKLDRAYKVRLKVDLEPNGWDWFVIR